MVQQRRIPSSLVVPRRRGRDQFRQYTGLLSDDRVGARGGLDRMDCHEKRDFV